MQPCLRGHRFKRPKWTQPIHSPQFGPPSDVLPLWKRISNRNVTMNNAVLNRRFSCTASYPICLGTRAGLQPGQVDGESPGTQHPSTLTTAPRANLVLPIGHTCVSLEWERKPDDPGEKTANSTQKRPRNQESNPGPFFAVRRRC